MDPAAGFCFVFVVLRSITMVGATITQMTVESSVSSRFARVVVTSTVEAADNSSATFTVQIPASAFIANFTMTVDGETSVARVLEKAAAKREYEAARKQGWSAGAVESVRGMEVFRVSVGAASGSSAIFRMTYYELLRRRRLGRYEQRLALRPGQAVGNFSLRAVYHEPEGFAFFEYTAPSEESASRLLTSPANTREVVYSPSVFQQGSFVVRYDINHARSGGVILVEGSHFVHYISPSGLQPLGKDVAFVIDVSGSMSGSKMEHTKSALLTILKQLRAEDTFNILTFATSVRTWKPRLVTAIKENLLLAGTFVRDEVKAKGNTNINEALLTALRLFPSSHSRCSLIVFLTDGNPTAGVTEIPSILTNVREANVERRVSVFPLGFGFDMRYSFLEQLAYANGGGGAVRRIYDEPDATDQLKDFFSEINSPTLLNVRVDYRRSHVDAGSLSQHLFPQYFGGSELVVSGRLVRPGDLTWKARVVGSAKEDVVDFEVVPRERVADTEPGAFLTKLWAYLKIKHLIKKMAIADGEERENLTGEALNLSLQYNFVTPLTSMVVLQREGFEGGIEESVHSFGATLSNSGPSPRSITSPAASLAAHVICLLFVLNI